MTFATDVQDQLRRFVVGFVRADDLSDWLDAHAQQVHDDNNPALRHVTDLTFSLLEDVCKGHRSEENARLLLIEFVPTTISLSDDFVQIFTATCTAKTVDPVTGRQLGAASERPGTSYALTA